MVSQQPLKKAAAARIVFPIYDSTGSLLSGATDLDSEYSLDGSGFSNCANEAIEIENTGMYYLDLLDTETSGDIVCVQVKTSSVTGKTSVLVFYTATQTLDEVDAVLDTAAADIAAVPTNPMLATEDGSSLVAIPQLDANVSTRAPANEYDTEMARITADVATEAKQDLAAAVLSLLEAIGKNKKVLDVVNSKLYLYDEAGTTVMLTWDMTDKNGDAISVDTGVAVSSGVPY
jgi:hypothetical protein